MRPPSPVKTDPVLTGAIFFLILISTIVLSSIAPLLFPSYFFYIAIAILLFFLFSSIDFKIYELFSSHLYIVSILFLLIPLLLGQITRGAVRWIQIGPVTIQPSEIVRPFLLLFIAKYAYSSFDFTKVVKLGILIVVPLFLILIQPSLGVSMLTAIGLLGVLLASKFPRRWLIAGLVAVLLSIPLMWMVLAPYQKQRITAFINPYEDPFGAGYNSIQSMISIGSGKLFGRGLGQGVQTQLEFLPEAHSDFIFAAIAEEMGFVGLILVLLSLFVVLWKLTQVIEKPYTLVSRAFVAGIFLTFLVQIIIHSGMNMGILPITGLPLPLVSAGGSSLVATMIALGMAVSAMRK
jgi:rod shape determining protein RodA